VGISAHRDVHRSSGVSLDHCLSSRPRDTRIWLVARTTPGVWAGSGRYGSAQIAFRGIHQRVRHVILLPIQTKGPGAVGASTEPTPPSTSRVHLSLILLGQLCMKTVVVRTVEILLTSAILAVAAHLLLILYFSRHSFSLSFMTIQGQNVAPPTILLMALILVRVSLRYGTSIRKNLSSSISSTLICVFMILYLANGVTKYTGDTLPARYLPLSILREGNFDLNEFQFLYAQGLPYYLHHLNSQYVSSYPVGPAIAALPFYLVTALGTVPPTDRLIGDLEKLAAASMVAISASMLYLALRRIARGQVALTLTVIYGLGTSSFSVSSQALWQHGPSQLALATGLYSLIRGHEEPGWIGLTGFSLAFAVICRPTDLLLVLPLGVYVLHYHRPQIGLFLLGMLPPGLFHLWYNYTYFNNPFFQPYGGAFWSTPLIEGLSGILLSPGRGLFIYSPILLGSFLGMALAWRRRGDPLLRALSLGILPTLLLYGKWISWWGDGPTDHVFSRISPPSSRFAWCLVRFDSKQAARAAGR